MTKVSLVYLNNTGYVFNENDYMKLRSEFRIIGKFIGTPSYSCGFTPCIPVKLTQFETQLLVEKGIANLLKKSTLSLPPNEKATEEIVNLYTKRIEEQKELFINNKIKQSKENISKILLGKKKKCTLGMLEEDNKITEDQILNEIRDQIKFQSENALLEISCQHIHSHRAEILNEFPSHGDIFKYSIFKDIWEKGFYITPGEAFGADFIVYTGDPLIYHASYIIIAKHNVGINLYDMITRCRLAVTVNKTFIYVYQNCTGNISYQIIRWEGQSAKKK